MRLPVTPINNGADLTRGVDGLVAHMRATMQPRQFRDAMLALNTLQRIAGRGATVIAGESATDEVAQATANALVQVCAREAEKALGYK